MNNNKLSLRRLTVAALFAALVTILTMFASIPIPGGHGYVHLGDSMIYACAWAVGGPIAGVAAAIGSALADVLLGWSQYAPATLIIKFAMGFVCYLIMKAFKYKTATNIFAMAVAAVIMLVGYSLFEYILVGIGGAMEAFVLNLGQAIGGVVLGTVFVIALDKIKALDQFIAWKVERKNG